MEKDKPILTRRTSRENRLVLYENRIGFEIEVRNFRRKIYIVVVVNRFMKLEVRTMSEEIVASPAEEKEARLNLDFVEFVDRMKKEELVPGNKDKLMKAYTSSLGLKWNNMPTVAKRTLRPEVRDKLKTQVKDHKAYEEKTRKLMAIVGGAGVGRRYL